MRKFMAIWRRELSASFLSPVAYVTMLVFLLMTGLIFWDAVTKNVGTGEPLAAILCAAVVVCQTILVTVVCMRLFAEERHSGTLETLMTAPVTETQVVLGKYAGAVSFVLLVVAPSVAFIFILKALSPGIETVDMGALLGSGLIVGLTAALAVAVGLLASLTTRNQIVAGIACFCAIWMVYLLGSAWVVLPGRPSEMLAYVSAMEHVGDFSRGLVDTRVIALYLSFTAFVLFTAIRVLECRRWR